MRKYKGLFITFEGGEGSGKTTIINRLVKRLVIENYKVVSTREPGGSEIAESIRNILLNVENTAMDSRTEALLYAASRRQHLTEVVIPNLKANHIVLCDRYLDSSLVYQGYARGLGIENVLQMNEFATDGLFPDLTIYLDLDPEIGLKRIEDNGRVQNRLDLEALNFHNLVRKGYLIVAKMYPKRIIKVDGSLPKEELYNNIEGIILQYLSENVL